ELRIGFQPDLVARFQRLALPEDRHYLGDAETREDLDFRASGLDNDDLYGHAIFGDCEVLRPHAVNRRPAVTLSGRTSEGQLHTIVGLENGRAVQAHAALEEIHRR